MNAILLETGVILLRLVANGVFAMTEIAVVSARKVRLRRLAETGDMKAKAALELAESPNRFLATVQVGITLVGVLALDRLPVRDIMTPRAKIIWINQADPHEAIWHKIVVSGHSHYPVYAGSRDKVTGMLSLKAIYANLAAGIPVNVRDLLVPPMFVASSQTAASLLETFKWTGQHLALVTDEAGRIIGLVTALDVTEAIVGEFPSTAERLKPEAKQRPDGSWLVDGFLPLETLEPLLARVRFPSAERRDYATIGEFAAVRLGHPPREGETFDEQGCRFEILDMDGPGVDKLLITPLDSGSPLLKTGGCRLKS